MASNQTTNLTPNENARQGFWNGSRAPIGYRIVGAGQRGQKTKKTLAASRSLRLGKLENGGNLRAQFCSEVARPRGFEPLFSP